MSYTVIIVDDERYQARALEGEITFWDPNAKVEWRRRAHEAQELIENSFNVAFVVVDVYVENTGERADWLVEWLLTEPRYQDVRALIISRLPDKLRDARQLLRKYDLSRVTFQTLGGSKHRELKQAIHALVKSAQQRFPAP